MVCNQLIIIEKYVILEKKTFSFYQAMEDKVQWNILGILIP
jgi:hypothetical protein